MDISSSSSWASTGSSDHDASSSNDDQQELDSIIDEAVEILKNYGTRKNDNARIKRRLTLVMHGPVRICNISDEDAFSHFRFRKAHLQEVSDKLWPRLSQYLMGTKDAIQFGLKIYSAPFETLLLMVLFRLARPWRICNEMEDFFGFGKSKLSAGILTMVNALHSRG